MERLSEAIETLKGKVLDEGEHYLVKDVVLLSEFSKNKSPSGKPRRYTSNAMKESLSKFEGLQVNVNHPPIAKDPNSPTGAAVLSSQRDVLLTIGKTTNPSFKRVKESDGSYVHKVLGDIQLIKVPASEHIVGLIKLDPKLAGMSITGDGELKESEDYLEITELTPSTVDVVHRPATTKGFFESQFSPDNKAEADKVSNEDAKKYAETAKTKAEAAAKQAGESKAPEDYVAAAMRYREASRLAGMAAYKALEAGEVDAHKEWCKCETECRDISYQLDQLGRDKISAETGVKEEEQVNRSINEILAEINQEEEELGIAEIEDPDEDEDEDEDEDFDEEGDDEDFEDEGEDDDLEDDDEDMELEDEDSDLDADEDDLEDGDDDLGIEDLDEEGMEDVPEAGGGVDFESAKQSAIQASNDANAARTAIEHVKAKYANFLAAGAAAQMGDFATAAKIESVALQHDAVARKLKAAEKPVNPMASPEGTQGAGPEQVTATNEHLQKAPEWLREVYDESKHSRDEGGKFSGKGTMRRFPSVKHALQGSKKLFKKSASGDKNSYQHHSDMAIAHSAHADDLRDYSIQFKKTHPERHRALQNLADRHEARAERHENRKYYTKDPINAD